MRLIIESQQYSDSADAVRAVVEPLVTPYLRRRRTTLADVRVDEQRSTAPYLHELCLTSSTRGKTLQDLYDVADATAALVQALDHREITRETVHDIVLGGRPDLLIGQPEGPWLDVKSQHYSLTTDRGKISLAQSVARFCNAERGGTVIVGMSTKTRTGETISAVSPVPVESKTLRQYRQAIESRLFPFPFGLEIEMIETSPGMGLAL